MPAVVRRAGWLKHTAAEGGQGGQLGSKCEWPLRQLVGGLDFILCSAKVRNRRHRRHIDQWRVLHSLGDKGKQSILK